MLEKYDDVLTFVELCEILKVGRNKGYNLLNTNEIESIRVGRGFRIPKDNVVKYLCKPTKQAC